MLHILGRILNSAFFFLLNRVYLYVENVPDTLSGKIADLWSRIRKTIYVYNKYRSCKYLRTHTHTHTHTHNIPLVILKITWKDSLTMLTVVNSGIILTIL